ncbi:MAG TPA: TolC family protein [Nitrospirota bacterium]
MQAQHGVLVSFPARAMRILSAALICSLSFFSPAPAETKLTLHDCIEKALKNQPSLRAAQEGVTAGQSRETQATSPYLPRVTASTGYQESHQLGGALGDTVTKSYATTLSVNQTLYDFGRTGNALDAARFGTHSAEFDADRAVQEAVLNVKQAYFALLQGKRLVTVSQKTLEQAVSHLNQAEAFFHAGSRPRFDVTRAEVEVNSAKLGLINSKNSVRIRTIALYNAMGVEPGGELDIDDVLSAPAAVPPFEQAKDEALKGRPEMRKAGSDIEAARARVKAEESNYLPTLSATGAYNWAHGTSRMGMFQGEIQDSWNAGVTLSLPLFEGGITRGRVAEARANLRALEAQRDALRQSILIEVNQSSADLESAQARTGVMESSLAKARENLTIAEGRYEAGVGPSIEVTDAQVAALNAETDYVQALYDYQLAAARLMKAMGRLER